MALRSDVQLRALQNAIVEEGHLRPGSVFWTTPARARAYIDQRVAEPLAAPLAGPSETKPMEPQEKKSLSGIDRDGLLTDLPKSSTPFLVSSSFASPPARVSLPARSRSFGVRMPRGGRAA